MVPKTIQLRIRVNGESNVGGKNDNIAEKRRNIARNIAWNFVSKITNVSKKTNLLNLKFLKVYYINHHLT